MPLELNTFLIEGPVLLSPVRIRDARGFFSETYSVKNLTEVGIDCTFVQDNHSLSTAVGTIRGLHFQKPPHVQDKLVRVLRGSILSVVLDIRVRSPTFGKYQTAELSAENWRQLFIPKGFAHGFCTLAPDTEVFYKASDYYAPECEGGLLWNDADLAISWPPFAGSKVSKRDQKNPTWREIKDHVE